jgi:integrase/recombinase XerC
MVPTTAITQFLRYLKFNGRAPLTVTNYHYDLEHFSRFCEKRKLEVQDVGSEAALDFIEQYENEGKSVASVNRMKASVNGLYRYLLETCIVTKLPFAAFRHGKLVRRPPRPLQDPERERLLKTLGFRPDLYLLGLLYLGKGLRLSEGVGLDLSDIEGRQTIRVVGKGSRVRYLDRTEDLDLALEHWLVERARILAKANPKSKRVDRRALFVNKRGWRLSARRAEGLIRDRFDEVGLKHLSPHGLRHAFAKRLMDQGTDIRTVQELLGHKNVATTQIYTDVTREDMRNALQREAIGRSRRGPRDGVS